MGWAARRALARSLSQPAADPHLAAARAQLAQRERLLGHAHAVHRRAPGLTSEHQLEKHSGAALEVG
jgi:hypothetical protein